MKLTETISTTPLQAETSVRNERIRVLSSCNAGRIHPVAYAGLFREDRVARGACRVHCKMDETAEPLLNPVNMTAHAYFIPFLAFERFGGSMDRFNRSYAGKPDTDGGDVIPFLETISRSGNPVPLYDAMGVHFNVGDSFNSSLVEAYNAMVNYRYRARSVNLPERNNRDHSLAACFWKNSAFNDIVPDYDQAMIDGDVPLELVGRAPVSGIGFSSAGTPVAIGYRDTTGSHTDVGWSDTNDPGIDGNEARMFMKSEDGAPAIYAELQSLGVQLSLANIEMAKQTAAFAAIRKRYSGLDEDHIIDLLMEGIRVPDAALSQPILLARKSTLFGMNQRYATDGGNLNKSVTEGDAIVDLNFRCPPMNTGGIILITCEIVPEQLFEHQQDDFLAATSVESYPNFTRDYLDPEKVDIVTNKQVSVYHSNPDATFGYRGLNRGWDRDIPRIGGRFFRKPGDVENEERMRIWAVERDDPTLTEDFYLATHIHHDVFAYSKEDNFEVNANGNVQIIGHTVMGKKLHENTDDFDKLIEQVDTTRIDQSE